MWIDKIVFKMHARKCIFYIIQGNSRYCNTSWNRLQLPKVHHTYIAQPVSRQRNTHTHTQNPTMVFLNKPLNVSAFVHQFHKEKTKMKMPIAGPIQSSRKKLLSYSDLFGLLIGPKY